MALKDSEFFQYWIIIAVDFNVTLSSKEKQGGNIFKDPFNEKIEDLIEEWDLINIKPSKGNFTWSNKRLGLGHIAMHLDRSLIQSDFIVDNIIISLKIIPYIISDHKPIALMIQDSPDYGPLPFRFNPL
jgi:hypothetical protein